MAKETMTRSASDNAYLHKDFHGALSTGIAFLEARYDAEEVREYVRQFARTYYAPLVNAVKERGLSALRDHLQRIYSIEEARADITFSEDELILDVPSCPAVKHMREHDYAVAPLFFETSRTLYEALVDGSPFAMEWLAYEPATGRTKVRFYRRAA